MRFTFAPPALHRGSPRLQTVSRSRQPDHTRTRPRLEGLEERCLLSGIANYTEYPIPGGERPWYITQGSDGNLWFTENLGVAVVGMINPTTHAISQFSSPSGGGGTREITTGSDGNIWFTEWSSAKLGTVNTTTHVVTEFTLPTNYGQPWAITAGPGGDLWFTAINDVNGTLYGAIGSFSPTSHVFTMYTVPGSYMLRGITEGPDGNLWFTDDSYGKIGEFNPTTHAIAEYAIPTSGKAPSAWDITVGADGNLWFTVANLPSAGTWVGTISPATDAITLYPTTGSTLGITSGPDGNLWVGANGQLDEVNPTTDVLTQYPIGANDGLATGPDGNLWITDPGTDAIGVATLAPTQTDLVVTQQPPSGVTAGARFGLAVTAEDASGNVITSFNGTVTLALGSNPGGGTLGGTLTATAVNGVATFSGLTLTKAAGGYTLVTSAGLYGEGITNAFAVTAATATQLVITQQPSSVSVNASFTIVAQIEDQYGNVVTSDDNAVTVAIAKNPGGATLGGTTTITAVNGVVTFSNLTLNKKAKGYTLTLKSPDLTSATTTAINAS